MTHSPIIDIDAATRRFLRYAAVLLVLCGALTGCARMEDGMYVPESLPYHVIDLKANAPSSVRTSFVAGFDSNAHRDVVFTLSNLRGDKRNDKLAEAAISYDADRYFDQKHFAPYSYPGMQEVQLAPYLMDVNYDDTLDAIYDMYFPDSIVIGIHGWGPTERWLHRVTLGREAAHRVLPLALWSPPPDHRPIFVFRKSNRITAGNRVTTDTLFYLDLISGSVIMREPAGPFYGGSESGVVERYQRDSLLLLEATNSENGLKFAGYDDRHAYLVALRINGNIAWADTLHSPKRDFWNRTLVNTTEGRTVFIGPHSVSGERATSSTVTIRRSLTRDTLLRRALGTGIASIPFSTRHPYGSLDYYCTDWDNRLLRYDSAFSLISAEQLDFVPGMVSDVEVIDSERNLYFNGTLCGDVNNDSTNDLILPASSGQFVLIDGATLSPLAATRPFIPSSRLRLLDAGNGRFGLIVQHGDTISRMYFASTPVWSRILAHQDRIITAFLLLLVLPFSAVLTWRVEYFRQLFRALVSGDDVRGVLVIRVRPVGGILARRRGRHGSPVGGTALRPNARMQAMFDLDANHADDLGAYPPVVAAFAARALRSRERLREQISLRESDATRHVVLESRTIRLLGRFHRCVVTATDITESIEAERRRLLAEREARQQRDMLTTTVKIVHDAKTPLQTARLILNAMMIDDAGSFLATADAEREEQSAAIESSITEAVDIINRCLFLAREAQHNAGLRPMNLHQAVGAWCEKTASRYGSRGFTVRNTVPEDLPELMLDQTGLEFLLQCASDNAVQWTPHDSLEKAVRIAARRAPDAVVLEIIDAGVGMEPETVRRLLESPGFSLREMGSGLGMLIIHRVCAEHGARLSITSTLGEGTTIAISFPLSSDFTEHTS